ncbi:MAG: hypothetical protein R2867_44000 [Caldilineaceae bacterium]
MPSLAALLNPLLRRACAGECAATTARWREPTILARSRDLLIRLVCPPTILYGTAEWQHPYLLHGSTQQIKLAHAVATTKTGPPRAHLPPPVPHPAIHFSPGVLYASPAK